MGGKNDNALTYVVVIGVIILLLLFWFCRGEPIVNPPEPTPTPSTLPVSNHIRNGDFELGLTYWDMPLGAQSFSCGVSVGNDSAKAENIYFNLPRIISQTLTTHILASSVDSLSVDVFADIPDNVFTVVFKMSVFYSDESKTDFSRNFNTHSFDWIKVSFPINSLSQSKEVTSISFSVDTIGSYNPSVNYAEFCIDNVELMG